MNPASQVLYHIYLRSFQMNIHKGMTQISTLIFKKNIQIRIISNNTKTHPG